MIVYIYYLLFLIRIQRQSKKNSSPNCRQYKNEHKFAKIPLQIDNGIIFERGAFLNLLVNDDTFISILKYQHQTKQSDNTIVLTFGIVM